MGRDGVVVAKLVICVTRVVLRHSVNQENVVLGSEHSVMKQLLSLQACTTIPNNELDLLLLASSPSPSRRVFLKSCYCSLER